METDYVFEFGDWRAAGGTEKTVLCDVYDGFDRDVVYFFRMRVWVIVDLAVAREIMITICNILMVIIISTAVIVTVEIMTATFCSIMAVNIMAGVICWCNRVTHPAPTSLSIAIADFFLTYNFLSQNISYWIHFLIDYFAVF